MQGTATLNNTEILCITRTVEHNYISLSTVLSEIYLCSTVRVIHKISVLLYQHNGDDTPQNHIRILCCNGSKNSKNIY